ncbi:Hypothetical protein SMAX5B_009709 [Scophthalmus maximus]|uniref:Uncharacterized protein n=1 Tax=Scophthalmus maximus TaxID=52904 RepID=A0A2U9CYP7_SCOMX|nr:Hypothetical protein SMAX5B_009709 [Scophthalmus maximus]
MEASFPSTLRHFEDREIFSPYFQPCFHSITVGSWVYTDEQLKTFPYPVRDVDIVQIQQPSRCDFIRSENPVLNPSEEDKQQQLIMNTDNVTVTGSVAGERGRMCERFKKKGSVNPSHYQIIWADQVVRLTGKTPTIPDGQFATGPD